MAFEDEDPARRSGSPIDETIAETWTLLGIPNPLPLIDSLLAATAKVHGLILVTRNITDIESTGVELLDPFSTQ